MTECLDEGDLSSFGFSNIKYDPSEYESQLIEKIGKVHDLFHGSNHQIDDIEIDVVKSPLSHFRFRCRFTITNVDEKINYAMWEHGEPSVIVQSFPIAASSICQVMPVLLMEIQSEPELATELKAVHFLATTIGDVVVTLLYHRHIGDDWFVAGTGLRSLLEEKAIQGVERISIIGRSKKVKQVIGTNCVEEHLSLNRGDVLKYIQVDDGFSNPNGVVSAKVLDWICDAIEIVVKRSALQGESHKFDILELYCGNGNHTVAIAGFARRVVAVEINKSLCQAAEENLALNGVDNAIIIPCDSQKFAMSVLRRKNYFCAATNEVIAFSMVLVDPPRCGLDPTTRRLIATYDSIVYISCSPEALHRDLDELCVSHTIVKFAAFDQFAYTPHLECGVLLLKKPTL